MLMDKEEKSPIVQKAKELKMLAKKMGGDEAEQILEIADSLMMLGGS